MSGDPQFTTIVADPPWRYGDQIDRTRRGAATHYPTMTLDEIAALPVPAWAADDAHLYLWATNAFVEAAHQIARTWGFAPKTLLTWVKPQIGMGHYFRNNTEHVIFAVRGKLPVLRRNCPTGFAAPRGRHSEKPAAFFEIVESMSPGPYLELFARTQRDGWWAWGNELEEEVG